MGLESILAIKENLNSLTSANDSASNLKEIYKLIGFEIIREFNLRQCKLAASRALSIRHGNWLDAKLINIELVINDSEDNMIASLQSRIIYGVELRPKTITECKNLGDYLGKLLRQKKEQSFSLEEKIRIYAENKDLFTALQLKVSSLRQNPDYLKIEKDLKELQIPKVNLRPAYELPPPLPVEQKQPEFQIPQVSAIKEVLDKNVIGHENAKKDLIVAIRNHYLAIKSNKENNTSIDKNCMFLMGPTGCGKTYLIKNIVPLFNVPYAIGDATEYTSHGFIGDDIEKIFARLYIAARGNMELAEKGIIFLDEFDKIRTRRNSWGKDINGEEVQSALLTKMESGEADLSRYIQNPPRTMQTKDILLILGGSFLGLDEVISERLRDNGSSIGFGRQYDKKNLMQQATINDIVNFGIKKELVGRCSVIISLNELTLEEMRRILTEPENSFLKQYQQLAGMYGLELEFEEGALMQIAEIAKGNNLGARAIKSILHDVTKDLFYSETKGKFVITKDYVLKNTKY